MFQISKKKLKKLYKTKENAEYDKADLVLYEEVTRMPPFKRKTLVLVGVRGVGRRKLKNRLINSDQTKFASIIPRKFPKIFVIGINFAKFNIFISATRYITSPTCS